MSSTRVTALHGCTRREQHTRKNGAGLINLETGVQWRGLLVANGASSTLATRRATAMAFTWLRILTTARAAHSQHGAGQQPCKQSNAQQQRQRIHGWVCSGYSASSSRVSPLPVVGFGFICSSCPALLAHGNYSSVSFSCIVSSFGSGTCVQLTGITRKARREQHTRNSAQG